MSKLTTHNLGYPWKFMVTISETLNRMVEVGADDQQGQIRWCPMVSMAVCTFLITRTSLM